MQIVNDLAAELLDLTPTELLAQPQREITKREVNGQEVVIGVDRYQVRDEYHVGIQLSRRWLRLFRATYVGGVVFRPDSGPRLMTPLEADENH